MFPGKNYVPRQEHEKGIDLRKEYPKFHFVVFMNSRLEREKNIALALSSLKIALKTNPRIGLIIAGSGRQKESLEKQAITLGLTDNVIFLGWQENVSSLYRSADLYLHTSQYEGYGMTLVEAALEHCPILSTPVGIIEDVFNTSNVLLCVQSDAKCFGKQILYATKHSEIIKSNAKYAGKAVHEHLPESKDVYLAKYGALWKGCVKGGT